VPGPTVGVPGLKVEYGLGLLIHAQHRLQAILRPDHLQQCLVVAVLDVVYGVGQKVVEDRLLKTTVQPIQRFRLTIILKDHGV